MKLTISLKIYFSLPHKGGKPMAKTMAEIQKEVDDFIGGFEEGYFSPLAMMARITEETGELAREINHYYGEKPKKTSEPTKTVAEELGDCLFVLTCMVTHLILIWKKHTIRSWQNLKNAIKIVGQKRRKKQNESSSIWI